KKKKNKKKINSLTPSLTGAAGTFLGLETSYSGSRQTQ
ncbi:MAG: hypothetical protein JWM77_777, partial [Rhodospirillales bacterium]|nr:hypothetical protein [Rhodospirillales bacterium]